MLATHRPWTKKELKARVAELASQGAKLPAHRVLLETSFFGPEIKPNATKPVCLDHPRRSKFATVTFDHECNIVKVA